MHFLLTLAKSLNKPLCNLFQPPSEKLIPFTIALTKMSMTKGKMCSTRPKEQQCTRQTSLEHGPEAIS